MKLLLALVLVFAVASAEYEKIDWARVRPMNQFPEYWIIQGLAPRVEPLSKVQPRIVGGENARPQQFPYQVAIFPRMAQGDGLCGATPITDRTVLTAAHCLRMLSLSESTLVVFGAHNISDPNEPSQVRIRVDSISYRIHPGWNPQASLQNDIALIVMPEKIQFNQHVQKVDLPGVSLREELFIGSLATISGWGIYSDETRRPSQILNFVTLPVISNERCSVLFPFMVNENNICVSGLSRQGGCQGDSGGPLTVQRGGRSIQVGIVSFGMGLACESIWPTVFSRITFFEGWIDKTKV